MSTLSNGDVGCLLQGFAITKDPKTVGSGSAWLGSMWSKGVQEGEVMVWLRLFFFQTIYILRSFQQSLGKKWNTQTKSWRSTLIHFMKRKVNLPTCFFFFFRWKLRELISVNSIPLLISGPILASAMARAMLLVEMLGVLEVLGGPGRNGVSARNKAMPTKAQSH